MNIQNILNLAIETDIKFTSTGSDSLIVTAPKGIIDGDFKKLLKSNKDQLIDYINSHSEINEQFPPHILSLSSDELEFFEERAAIMEYDGGLSKQEAEKLSFELMFLKREKRND